MRSFLLLAAVLPYISASPIEESRVERHPLLRRQKPSKDCSHLTGGVHVIATPGEGTSNPPYGLLGSLATSILKAIPGSTNVSVPYNHTETNGVAQSQAGANTLVQYINDYHHYCPNTKIVLLGYSAGAVITMNAVCGTTNPPYNPAIPPLNATALNKYVVTYGDQTRNKGVAWDKGTCTDQGLHPRRNPDGCNGWGGNYIHGYCDANDPQCCVATGTSQDNHYLYPQNYDKTATSWVVQRFKKFGA